MSICSVRGALIGAALVLVPVAASASSDHGEYTSFWVLGDSLSDPGNLSAATGGAQPGPAYFEGRFSNGPVWAEHVSADFDASGNFAYGGATAASTDGEQVPSLAVQSGIFQSSVPAEALGENPLVSLWAGANDLLNSIGGQNPDYSSYEVAVQAASEVFHTVEALWQSGIDDFLVFNLPDLGLSPLYQLAQPELAAEASQATQIFNDLLSAKLDWLRATASINIIEMDMYALFNELLEDPESFGVSDASVPCLFGGAICDDPENRAFYDFVHPTSEIHARIAAEVQAAIIPLPASLGFLMLGLAGLGAAGRRRLAA